MSIEIEKKQQPTGEDRGDASVHHEDRAATLAGLPEQDPSSGLYGEKPAGHVPTKAELAISRELFELELKQLHRFAERGLFDKEPKVGWELEAVVVGKDFRPAPIAGHLLRRHDDLQGELSAFNLEVTAATPHHPDGSLVRDIHDGLEAAHQRLNEITAETGASVLLTGICPTYRQHDFHSDNFVAQRYKDLNAALDRSSGGAGFDVHIDGIDDIHLHHPTILLEALNTSFQLNISAPYDEIRDLYNLTQAITAPLVAISANSPLIFGERGWHESRIPIWEQSTDPRNGEKPHALFGDNWIDEPLELFESLREFSQILLGPRELPDGLKLHTVTAHEGTVWRWNRIRYGVNDGTPHLRIEIRSLPGGPSVVDQAANAAFAIGLLHGLRSELQEHYGHADIRSLLSFEDVKHNFYAAAKEGLNAKLKWQGRSIGAADLCEALIPVADLGLELIGTSSEDREYYLGIIRDRAKTGQTGAEWLLQSFSATEGLGTQDERLRTIAAWTHYLQNARKADGNPIPVHEWPLASVEYPQ